MQDASSHNVARVRIDALQHLEPIARDNLPLFRNIDVSGSVQRDWEDALRFPGRSTDELPPLEEVCRAKLHALQELRDYDGEAHGDRLVRAGEEGDNEDGRRLEHLLALDLDDLLDLLK